MAYLSFPYGQSWLLKVADELINWDDKEAQKHLLHEELTQSRGFFKDSHDYPESMFYQRIDKLTKNLLRLTSD